MILYQSNRIEQLLNQLFRLLGEEAASPFAPEFLVLPNQAMSDWLSLELSAHFGAWSGLDFKFPKRAITDIMKAVGLPGAQELSRFEEGNRFFELLSLLEETKNHPDFTALLEYHKSQQQLFPLVERLSTLFDSYQTYRPDWILKWDQGDWDFLPPDQRFQGRLWQGLSKKFGGGHFPALAQQLLHQLNSHDLTSKLPPRVILFGHSQLPPYFVEIFIALSKQIPVHFFQVSPSAEFWADLKSKKDAVDLRIKTLEKQEKQIKDKSKALQEEVMKKLKPEK